MAENTETGDQSALNNNASVTVPVTTDNSNAEVERLKKEAEQARMRANQLENELAAKNKAEDEARQKQLEENEEYKTLFEREKERRESLEKDQQTALDRAKISTAKSEVLAKFPKEVVEAAEITGMSLSDASDEAKTEFENKLKALSDKIGPKKTASGNNQAQQVNVAPERAQLLDGVRRGDPSSTRQAISGLESLKTMRQIAGVEQVTQ